MAITDKSLESRLVENLADITEIGVVLLDPDLRVLFVGRSARRRLGCASRQEFESRWREEIQPRLEGAVEKGCTTRRTVRMSLTCEGRPTAFILRLYPLSDDACEGFVASLTEERSVEAFESALLVASKMSTAARLYATVTHELRAPLNSMVLTLEILKEELESTDPRKERCRDAVRIVKEELERFKRLLDGFLEGTKLPRSIKEGFHIADLLREVRRDVAHLARKQKIDLRMELPSDPQRALHGHRDWIKQAFLNLVLNAFDAMPEGGSLTVRMEGHGDRVTIHVRDSGPGIRPEILPRMWDMHFTTKESGTGIGLHVTRAIIESHGGSIVASPSPPEIGAVFRIELPLTDESGSTGEA